MTAIPCTVTWCDASTHPPGRIIRHTATVGTYAAGAVTIRLAWAERGDGSPTVGPHVQVFKGDPVNAVDPTPEEARVWASCLEAIDRSELPAFVRGLVCAAIVLEQGEGEDQ
jgi:hypothetical protein